MMAMFVALMLACYAGMMALALPDLLELFVPRQSTAKTCSNRCRQRLFRQQQRAKRVSSWAR